MASALNTSQRAILELLGPLERQASSLDQDQWHEVDLMAADQRLQPHLHARLQRGEIGPEVPQEIIDGWAAAYRYSAVTGLAQRRDLRTLAGALADEGIASVALKGSWLAWHAYPAAPERVLRDLDLLVAESDAPHALEVLLALGFTPLDPLPADPATFAPSNKQFPPLRSPAGTIVELHAHAWEPPGTMEWPTPPTCDAKLLAGAIARDAHGLRYLAPHDMLAHISIHAAYSHRFEVGPLLLSDVDYLLQHVAVDWNALWREAEAGRYLRGMAMTLALVDRWRRPGLLDQSGCPLPIGSETVDHASALLLQRSSDRQDTRRLAALQEARATGGLAKVAAVGLSRLGKAIADPARIPRSIARTARSAASPDAQTVARSSALVGLWIEDNA